MPGLENPASPGATGAAGERRRKDTCSSQLAGASRHRMLGRPRLPHAPPCPGEATGLASLEDTGQRPNFPRLGRGVAEPACGKHLRSLFFHWRPRETTLALLEQIRNCLESWREEQVGTATLELCSSSVERTLADFPVDKVLTVEGGGWEWCWGHTALQ